MNMKKYFPYLMMSALLALTACSSEGDEPQATELIPLTFVSEMGDDQTVITRYGSNVQSTQLVSGTKVGIYLYDAKNKVSTTGAGTYATNRFNKKNIEFTANGSGGWSNSYSWFWPENGNSVNVYAYAPYNSGWDLATAGTKTFSVPATQTDDSNYKSYDLLSGVAANPVAPATGAAKAVAITFTHKLSKVTINLTAGSGVTLDDVSSVQVLNTVLSGTVTIANNVISSVTKNGTTKTTITCGGAKTSSCSAIVIPGNAIATTDVLIRVNMTSGGVFDYKPQTAVTFAAGKNYIYNVTLNIYGLTVTSSITDWGSQTENGAITY